jgi:hypothetical protein
VWQAKEGKEGACMSVIHEMTVVIISFQDLQPGLLFSTAPRIPCANLGWTNTRLHLPILKETRQLGA